MREEQQLVLRAMNNSIRRAPSGHGPWIHDIMAPKLLDNIHDWLVEFGAQTRTLEDAKHVTNARRSVW